MSTRPNSPKPDLVDQTDTTTTGLSRTEAADRLRATLSDYEMSAEQRGRITTLLDAIEKQYQETAAQTTNSSVVQDQQINQQDSELIEELRETAAAIETEHPHITGAINRVLISLSSIGI